MIGPRLHLLEEGSVESEWHRLSAIDMEIVGMLAPHLPRARRKYLRVINRVSPYADGEKFV